MTEAEKYEEWFKGQDDPDIRGSSEYRAVYETLDDAMEEPEEMDDPFAMAEGILDEFIQVAQTLRTSLRNKQKEK